MERVRERHSSFGQAFAGANLAAGDAEQGERILGSRALRLGIAVRQGQDVVNAVQAGDELISVMTTEQ